MAKKAQIAAAAAADPETSTTTVNIADFQRTRDSVIVALATLQSSVSDLSRAYINHANTVLAPGRVGGLDPGLTNILSESGLLMAQAATNIAAPVIAEPEHEGKKKRKRTPHDPNAPKRALTPYFLYMQTARAQISKELGDQAKPKEVADEGTRRWTAMQQAEKSVWEDKYQENLKAYRVQMAAYKAGQPVPTVEEAARLVEAGKGPDHNATGDLDPDTEEEAAAAGAAETSEDEEPSPIREPSPPKGKRRKTKDPEPVKEPAKTPAKTPEKKGKKAKKEATPPPPPPATKASATKKKSKKA